VTFITLSIIGFSFRLHPAMDGGMVRARIVFCTLCQARFGLLV
jgi:hypothetical protein